MLTPPTQAAAAMGKPSSKWFRRPGTARQAKFSLRGPVKGGQFILTKTAHISRVCAGQQQHQRLTPDTVGVSTVCFQIIGNLETMHYLDLPTFLILELPIIWKRTRTYTSH